MAAVVLNEADQKNLAIGKALSMVGSVVGVIGGLYVVSTNPYAKAQMQALWKKLPVPLQENKTFTYVLGGLAAAAVIAKLVVSGKQEAQAKAGLSGRSRR